jgi:hypothetical protein
VAQVLSSALGRNVATVGSRPELSSLHATLSMVSTESLSELAVAIVASRASGTALAKAIVRAPYADDMLIRELLSEMCNNVLGAIKTAMRDDGYAFTLGIPRPTSTITANELRAAFTGHAVFGYDIGEAELHVILGARLTTHVPVTVANLTEGMIVAQNVLAGSDMIMVPAGTRLSATTIQRLVRQLPGRTVQICKMIA